jgi:hypothetical protein
VRDLYGGVFGELPLATSGYALGKGRREVQSASDICTLLGNGLEILVTQNVVTPFADTYQIDIGIGSPSFTGDDMIGSNRRAITVLTHRRIPKKD